MHYGVKNEQAPLGSGYSFRSTAKEIVQGLDLSGKLAIVTGGAAGIGLETTLALASVGATIVVGVRDPERAAGPSHI